MALKVGELFATLNIKDDGFNKTLGGLTGSIMKGLGGAWLIDKAFTAIGNGIKSCVSVGSSFESAMSQVAATMGTTVDQIGDIEATALKMGSTTNYTATQAAEGMNILAQAGLKAEDQIASIETVLKLAGAGGMSLDQSASYITASVKGFGDGMENAAFYADMIAKGATLANTNVAMLGEAFSSSAATANSYKQEAGSLTLSLLRLAEQNVTGSEAATALNRTMQSVFAPTKQAKAALDSIGVSAYDSNGNIRDFNDVLLDIQTNTKSLSDEARNGVINDIFGTIGSKTYNKMIASNLATVQKFKDGIASAGGSAAQQYATMTDNLKGDVDLFKSAVEGLEIAVYKSDKGMLRSTVQTSEKIVNALHKSFDEGFSSESLASVFDTTFDLFGQLGARAGEMALNLVDAFVRIAPTLGTKISEGVQKALTGLTARMPQLFGNLAQALPSLFESGGDIMVSLTEALFQSIQAGIGALIPMIPTLAPIVLQGFLNMFQTVAQGLAGVVTSLFTAIFGGEGVNIPESLTIQLTEEPEVEVEEPEPPEIPHEISDGIAETMQGAYETMTNGVLEDDKGARDAASQAVKTSLDNMTGKVDQWQNQRIQQISNDTNLSSWEKEAQIGDVIDQANAMRDKITECQTASDEWLNTNSEAATKTVEGNREQIDGIISGITEAETQLNELMENLEPKGGGEGIGGETKNLGQQFVDSLSEDIDTTTLQQTFENIGEVISTGLTTGITNITDGAAGLIDAVTQLITDGLSKVGDEGSVSASLLNLGKSVLDSLVKGLELAGTGTGKIIESLSNLLQKAFKGLSGDKFTTFAKDIGGTILEALSGSITAASGAIGTIVTALAGLLGDALTQLGSEEFGESLKTIGGDLVDAISKAFGKAEDGAGVIFDAVKTLFTEALSPENVTGIITNAAEFVTSVMTSITGAINEVVNGDADVDFAGLGQAILDSIIAAIGAIGSGASSIITALGDSLMTLFDGDGALTNLTFDLSSLGTALINAIGAALNAAFKSAGKIIEAIGGVLQKIFTDDGIAEGVSVNFESLGSSLITALGQAIVSASSGAGAIITAIGDALSGLFTESVNGETVTSGIDLSSLSSALGKAIAQAAPFITEGATEISEAIGNLCSKISAADVAGKLNNAAKGIATELAAALSSEDFSATVTAIGNGIAAASGTIVSAASAIAVGLVQGLVGYIINPANWAGLASGIWSVVSSALHITTEALAGLLAPFVKDGGEGKIQEDKLFTTDQVMTLVPDIVLESGEFNMTAIEKFLNNGMADVAERADLAKILADNGFLDISNLDQFMNGETPFLDWEWNYDKLINEDYDPYDIIDGWLERHEPTEPVEIEEDITAEPVVEETMTPEEFSDDLERKFLDGDNDYTMPYSVTPTPTNTGDGEFITQSASFGASMQQYFTGNPFPVNIPYQPTFTPVYSDSGELAGYRNDMTGEFTKNLPPQQVDVPVQFGISGVSPAGGTDMNTMIATYIQTMMGSSPVEANIPITFNTGDTSGSVAGAMSGAVSAMNSAASGAVTAGASFGAGFVSGMSGMMGEVIAKASELARAAVQALQSGIKQGSPSKITAISGRFFSEGFANGIAEGAARVKSVVGDMAGMASKMTEITGSFAARPIEAAAANGAGQTIDYDRLASAMSARQQVVNLNGKQIARLNAENTASTQNARSRNIAIRYGG